MLTYIARRVLYSIPVLLVSSFLSFTFVSLAGDPTSNLRQNPRVSQLTLHLLQHRYHLDQSIPIRYWYWLQDVFFHKLGTSLITSQPIWPDITRTLGHTAQVVILADVIAVVLGVAVGIYSAVRQYSIFDYTFTSLSFLGFAMPVFWLALLLQVVFVDIYLKWHVRIFYTSQLNAHGNATWSLDRLQHIALPVIGLSIVSFALHARVDARRDQHRLRAHRTCERPAGAAGDHEACRTECLDPPHDCAGAQPRGAPQRRDRH
jgi:peptide/nickel transport system permease protein